MMFRHGVEDLVERAVRRWQLERRVLEEREANAVDPSGIEVPRFRQRPMITIARDIGSLGRRTGELVAERLGFDLYDREIVHAVADTARARDALIESLDERLQDRISSWVLVQFGRGRVTESEYLRGLFHVLLALGQHGHSVVMGRGAEFVLDPTATLRVRVFAPLEERVRRVAEREGVSIATARERVRQVDADRGAFIRHHYKRDRDDFAPYDLLLNTSTVAAEVAAETIATAFQGRFGRPTRIVVEEASTPGSREEALRGQQSAQRGAPLSPPGRRPSS